MLVRLLVHLKAVALSACAGRLVHWLKILAFNYCAGPIVTEIIVAQFIWLDYDDHT